MANDLSNLEKHKKRRSGLSWIRLSGRIKALSFVAVFALVGGSYLLYTHAATKNSVPAPTASPVSPSPTPVLGN